MLHFDQLFQQNKTPSSAQQQAWQRFSALGFPKQKQEQWRYTSLARLEKTEFALPTEKANTGVVDLGALSGLQTIWIRNGFVDSSAVQNALLSIRPIQEVMTSTPTSENALTHLNLALCNGGVDIHVKAGEQRTSLLIVHQSSAAMQTHVRNKITVAGGAEFDLIELFVGSEQEYWSNSVTEIAVGVNAKMSYAKLQTQSLQAFHTGYTTIHVAKDSVFEGFLLSKGSSLQREELHGFINGENAHLALYGLSMGKGKQHLDARINVEHLKGHTQSLQIFKSIMNEEARGVFNGRILIAQDAQKVESKQMHKGLLLSAHAEIDAKPELEIYADDVKAAHGATVGQLSELETFYLMSRGISRARAVDLLTDGFVRDVVGKAKLAVVQEYVRTQC